MVTVKVKRVIEIPDNFIEDAIIDPAGYGIGYWAVSAEMDPYARTYTVTEQSAHGVGDPATHVISYDKLAQVLVKIAYKPEYARWEDWAAWAQEAINELEAGEEFPGGTIDSELADAIVQFAAFGELIYG